MHLSIENILVPIILALLIASGALHLNILSQKKRIRDLLRKTGAKNIMVSWMPFDVHITTNTYSVEYEDQNRIKHVVTCKFDVLRSSIHWEGEE